MAQGNHTLMEAVHQLVLVGDHQHRDAHFAHPLQQLHHFQTQLRVNVAGGLVRDDQLGVMHQRTRHSHTLLLAAGKGIRVALGLILQMHQLQNVLHAGTDLLVGHVEDVHGKGHTWDQPEVLKDDAHLTAQVRDLVAAQFGYVLAQYSHLAGGRQCLSQNELEQGGFACA